MPQTLERKIDELGRLLDAFSQLNSNLDLHEVFDNILNQMIFVVKAEAATLWILKEEDLQIEAVAVKGPVSSSILRVKLNAGEGIVGQVIESGQAELLEDASIHPNFANRVDEQTGFKTKSMITVPLIAKGKTLGALQLINKQQTSFFNEEDIQLAVTLANQSAIALQNSQMYDALNHMFLSMIQTLAKTLDARDPYTAGHSERVAKYSVWIAERLGFQRDMLDELYKAALLHDVGKIGVPDAVLLKQTRLTGEEYEIIKQHTTIGASILLNMEPKQALQLAVETAKYHHERLNGTGYPEGLKADEIPLFAKIVGVVDSFDAMTTVRPYSKGLTLQQACEELVRCKGSHYDEIIVDTFITIVEEKEFNLNEPWSYEL
jgi:HD-GYP domain-containing protein (c-di-GMP phosphodiesterase class II)